MGKLGLVLSGGGSKGSYQIGVCKALKQLHIEPDVITGTSIGAINGVFIVQNDLKNAIKFWKKINFEKMYREEDFPKMEDPKLSDVYKQYIKTFLNEGGMDIAKIKDIFDSFFNPTKFFNSNIRYGLVTFNLTKKKPLFITKEELKKDDVKKYVLASASCYPAYKPYVINDELYIDGGYYDNIPINLAIDLGASRIIAVDLRAVGLKKRIKNKNVDVTYIYPRNKLGSFLVFDGKQAIKGMKYGYNDAMKTFGKLDGDKFTFKKNNLIKNYNRYNDIYEDNLNKIFSGYKNRVFHSFFQSSIFKEIINRKTKFKNFNNIVEKSGEIFHFEQCNIYNIKSFNNGLLNNLSNTISINKDIIVKRIKDKNIKKVIDGRQIVKYFYNSIICGDRQIIKFIPFFQDEFFTALYIFTIAELNITY